VAYQVCASHAKLGESFSSFASAIWGKMLRCRGAQDCAADVAAVVFLLKVQYVLSIKAIIHSGEDNCMIFVSSNRI
jgi:hypothetical protein